MDRRRDLGRVGERIAERYLAERGVQVMRRNVQMAGGEIDLVGVVDGVLTAIEVRSVTGAIDPSLLFPHSKRMRVARLARVAGCHRVDLVAVHLGSDGVEVRWFRDVR